MELVQITGWIDQGLNEKAYIIPGLGDFGERRWFMFPFYHYIFLTIEQGIVNNQPMAFVKIITLPAQTLHRKSWVFFSFFFFLWVMHGIKISKILIVFSSRRTFALQKLSST